MHEIGQNFAYGLTVLQSIHETFDQLATKKASQNIVLEMPYIISGLNELNIYSSIHTMRAITRPGLANYRPVAYL